MAENNLTFEKTLEFHTTPIPGLIWFDLPVHGDSRGWFKENWQREKMTASGLPDFGPVQNNMSFNDKAGTTRGIHAEPWDKYVSVGTGRIFGAWVDLRAGDTFGTVFTLEVDPTKAVFVPRGVGNSFQVLEPNTLYSYLVNDHWSAENTDYAALNLADPTVAIPWPISLKDAELSEKDKATPLLAAVTPIQPKKVFIVGANGQLGLALHDEYPDAEFVDRDEFDITKHENWKQKNWRQYSTIINVAAFTQVDAAETPEGRVSAWEINAKAVQYMAEVATENHLILVHISTDYVFDGTKEEYTEDDAFAPLSVYGNTKAAADIAAATVPTHYIVRTSWVIGEGKNFVTIMKDLAEKGVKPSVVNDQIGRLTFTADLAKGIKHLLSSSAPYGTYNLTGDGEPVSWAEIAKQTYTLTGHNANDITEVSTEEYYTGKEGIAPRPLNSTLRLDKIRNAGFTPRPWDEALEEYLRT